MQGQRAVDRGEAVRHERPGAPIAGLDVRLREIGLGQQPGQRRQARAGSRRCVPRPGPWASRWWKRGTRIARQVSCVGMRQGEVLDEPGALGVERGRTRLEWPEHRPMHRAEVGRPPSVPCGFHVRRTLDRGRPERQQIP
jgi:hypothetical protein